MYLVEVYRLHPQPLERSLAGANKVVRTAIVRRSEFDAAFGRQHDPVTQGRSFGEHAAKQGFRRTEWLAIVGAIDVGRVKQVEARLDRSIYPCPRCAYVVSAEAPETPANPRNAHPPLAEGTAGVGSENGHCAQHIHLVGFSKGFSMSALRFGIVGAGMMAREHIRNIRLVDTIRLVALADPEPSSLKASLEEAGGRWGDIATFDSVESMVAGAALDAVIVSSPNFTHRAVLEPLFDASVHILCEKPLCTALEDARWVVDRAERHKAVFWTAMEYRFMPPAAQFVQDVRAGSVGRLVMLTIREHRFPFLVKVGDWNRFSSNTGGTMVEKCCHFFDLMRLIVNAEPVRVFCSGAMDVNHLDERYGGRQPDIIDNSFTIVDFDNGVRAMLDLCMFAEGAEQQETLTAVGDTARLEAFIPAGDLVRSLRVPLGAPKQVTKRHVPVDEAALKAGTHHGSVYYQLLAFLDAIMGTGPTVVTAMDGLRAVAIGAAAEISAREGRVVTMAELGF